MAALAKLAPRMAALGVLVLLTSIIVGDVKRLLLLALSMLAPVLLGPPGNSTPIPERALMGLCDTRASFSKIFWVILGSLATC